MYIDSRDAGNLYPRTAAGNRPASSACGSCGFGSTALTLLGGLGVGAAVVYMLDPDKGADRRHWVADRAGSTLRGATNTFRGAGDTLGSAWNAVAETVADKAHVVADRARQWGSNVVSHAPRLPDVDLDRAKRNVRDTAYGAGRGVKNLAANVSGNVRGWFAPPPPKQEWYHFSAASEVLGVLGLVALGGAAMCLFDPQLGRARRGMIRDKFISLVNHTGEAIEGTALHLRNRAAGMVAQTKSKLGGGGGSVDDRRLVERVRSQMGRLVSNVRAIEVCARDGAVILSGPILQAEMDGFVEFVTGVPGVKAVHNGLLPHERRGNFPALQGSRPPVRNASWVPVARAISGVIGGAMAVAGVVRRDLIGVGLGALGLGVLARASVRPPVRHAHRVGAPVAPPRPIITGENVAATDPARGTPEAAKI